MIDVPERVKDALREGDQRKNYKFTVYKIAFGYIPTMEVSNVSSYDVIDLKPIKLVGTQNFTAVVASYPLVNEIPATQGSDNLYYVEIPNPLISDVVGVTGLPEDTDTVQLYHWTDDGEWTPFDEISNESLVKESVKFDERMCSGSELKFGLCEGSSLEFQYFDHDSITGCRIFASVEVQYKDEDGNLQWHNIPMGWYDVSQCPRQFSTGIYKVTAYNKLRSAYLDQKANIFIEEQFQGRTSVYFFELRKALTNNYEIDSSVPVKFGVPEVLVGQINSSTYTLVAESQVGFPFYGSGAKKASIGSLKYTAILDPDKFNLFTWLRGDVDAFEDYLYDTALSGLLTTAVGSSSKNAILSSLISSYAAGGYNGCYTVFGAVITMRDGTKKIYSKRAYDNNRYGAVGKVSDLLGVYLRDVTQIDFYMPFCISLNPDALLPSAESGEARMIVEIEGQDKEIRVFRSVVQQHIEQGVEWDYVTHGYYDFDNAVDWYTHKPVDVGQRSDWDSTSGSVIRDGFQNIVFLWNYSIQAAPSDAPWPMSYMPYYFDLRFTDGTSTSTMNYRPANQPAYGSRIAFLPDVAADPLEPHNFFRVTESEVVGSVDLITINPSDLADITTRDAVSAVYELSAYYGRLDRRTDFFAPIELNNSRLLPADDLYPADSLYPNGNSSRANRSMYQKLWTDSQGVQSFRYLIITYKTLIDGQETETEMQKTINPNGTTDYYMSDNWLLRNLVWTEQQVSDLADEMIARMSNVTWFPFEMWCAGLPYLETGDELEITTAEGTYTSYILQRQLNGIQNLQDTYIDGELDIF